MEQAGKVLLQSVKDFTNDNSPQWAAAIAYYTVLSLFPLLLAATAIAAYFVDPSWAIQQGSDLLQGFLPGTAQYVRQIVEGLVERRGQVGAISLVLLLWSGSRVFGVITKALNIAYDVNEPYGFWKRTLVEFLMTFTIGILFALALGSRLALRVIGGLGVVPTRLQETLFSPVVGYIISALLLLGSMLLTYRFVPRRRIAIWCAAVGAVTFTALFLVAQPLFSGYIRSFANYNLVYGPLAVVVTFVIWVWISANLLLFGGEVASHIQDMVVDQKTEQQVDAQHRRRDPTSPLHGPSIDPGD